MPDIEPVDRKTLRERLRHDQATFHELLDHASPEDLKRASDGTRWNNEQLLFHMLFGYLIVRALLPVVRIVSRVPRPAGRGFARSLDATTRPFNAINYWGSCIGARVIGHRRMGARLDAVMDSLQRHLDRDDESELHRSMPYPSRWDPYFNDTMSRADLYRYGSQHFEHHRKQLTLTSTAPDA